MSFLDRALRMGEAKKFKSYEQRVGRINAFEAELETYTDAELREAADELRARARGGEFGGSRRRGPAGGRRRGGSACACAAARGAS